MKRRFRRLAHTDHTNYIGLNGSLSINTTEKTLHVHDGVTQGGKHEVGRDTRTLIDGKLYALYNGEFREISLTPPPLPWYLEPITDISQLIAGDLDAGYAGEVTAEELFTGSEVALESGLDAGSLMNNTAGWLKFAWKGDTIFIAKMPLRNNISWDNLHSRGLSTGTTTVSKDGVTFSVRLLTGAYANPFVHSRNGFSLTATNSCQGNFGEGSMWNDLLYRVHSSEPSCPENLSNHGGAQAGENWETFSNSDLGIGTTDGSYNFCLEASSTDTSRHLSRGFSNISDFTPILSNFTGTNRGWRPVLVMLP